MFRSSVGKWILGVIVLIAVLGVLRFKPWQRGGAEQARRSSGEREQLGVGFLPVT